MMRALLRDRRGHTAIEYSMIAALIAILLITALTSVGLSVESMFDQVFHGFDGVAP